MDPSVQLETAAHYHRDTHMRTPTGMISGMHIEAFMAELYACTSRDQQIKFLNDFHSTYHLNDGFYLETTLMLLLNVDAPDFDGSPDFSFMIDVYSDIGTPVPLECAPGHIIEVYGQWKSKIEEWMAGAKPCPLTRVMKLKYTEIPAMNYRAGPPLFNPYANGDKE